jgi:hypothetical protein
MLTIQKLMDFRRELAKGLDMDVIIAGGAPRDLFHGKPVKDIDVFVGGEAPWDLEERVIKVLGLETLAYTKSTDSYDGQKRNVLQRVTDFHALADFKTGFVPDSHPVGFYGAPVQVISTLPPPRDVVRDEFDFGLCEIWIGEEGLRWTKRFWHDHERKRLTLRKGGEVSSERLERLCRKYIDYSVVGLSPETQGPLTAYFTRLLNHQLRLVTPL